MVRFHGDDLSASFENKQIHKVFISTYIDLGITAEVPRGGGGDWSFEWRHADGSAA